MTVLSGNNDNFVLSIMFDKITWETKQKAH